MSGKKGGCSSVLFENRKQKAVYFHCASHELNLCLSKAFKVTQVSKVIGTMQFLGQFYKFSSKRQREPCSRAVKWYSTKWRQRISTDLGTTASRQTLRDKVEHTSKEEYYRRSISLPFLDSLLQQLNDRFQGKTKDAVKGMYLIPSNNDNIDTNLEIMFPNIKKVMSILLITSATSASVEGSKSALRFF